jgi:hypothetical protein
MTFFHALTKGAVKSAASYKLVLVVWLVTLFFIWPVALILKTEFSSFFGAGMLIDSSLGGFDLGVVGDLGERFQPFLFQTFIASLLMIIAGLIINAFFAGGFFAKFTTANSDFKVPDFFKSSAHFFFTFLGTSVIVTLMIFFWGVIIIAVPILVSGAADKGAQVIGRMIRILGVLWLLGLPVLLLVADHARRWMAVTGTRKIFMAIGTGFRETFKRFFRAYISVFLIVIASIAIVWLSVILFKNLVPEKGFLIFLFFIGTQLIAIIKTWVRSWRYATVTELTTIAEN